ncbi:excinuclease ABC subunit A, partial [Listeria monocytogenes]
EFPESNWLFSLLVVVCGFGRRTAVRLLKLGFFYLYHLSHTPPLVFIIDMGVVGEILYFLAQGFVFSLLNEKFVPVSLSFGI